jgi:hypothetical protein
VKHDFETQMKRDARAAEHPIPAGMLARVREQLERERAPEAVEMRLNARPLLVAAAILVAAGGIWYAMSASSLHEQSARNESSHSLAAGTLHGPGAGMPTVLALTWPSQGMSFAARAGEPLSREWENVKSDSKALLRGFERQIPRLPTRE